MFPFKLSKARPTVQYEYLTLSLAHKEGGGRWGEIETAQYSRKWQQMRKSVSHSEILEKERKLVFAKGSLPLLSFPSY